MLLTVSIFSFITNAFLLYRVIKQSNSIEELEIKLKVTRDYANTQAQKSLKTEVKWDKVEMTSDAISSEVKPKKNTRRGRKKKPNNNNAQ